MKRILINCAETHTLTALTEEGRLVELFIDGASDSDGSWVGRIIVGRIKTILPGQFAFVDIGAKKNAFINLKKGHGLKAGQAILVQVEKDAVGTKGMCVTLQISLKGRLVVLQESAQPTVGISRKIEDEKEARRLRKIANKLLPKGYCAIIRTNAKNQTTEAIAEEMEALHELHKKIVARSEFALPPKTLHSTTFPGLLPDLLSDDLEEICIQAEDEKFALMKSAVLDILPCLENKISRQIFSLQKQIREALKKEVSLPCGGTITIEQTEACVVIDVNTASNVGKINYSETVLETNLQAAAVLAAQMRLRNLSGIIIVDFIDMSSQADKDTLLNTLEAEIKKDRIKTEIIGFMGLGMLQMTRQKMRPPIAELVGKFNDILAP
ncbi:MAG: ribonuclease E/G [Defluviitaleaceae bacterium]|nr:ribonuclease E/G [Defluviitaleaceae bacterium]